MQIDDRAFTFLRRKNTMPTVQRVQTILNSLNEQVKTGHLCDVLFYGDSGNIWAHSCVLEGFSPFFSQLFSNCSQKGHHWSIKQPFQISVSHITKCKSPSKNNCMHCLAQIVQYIYTGNIKPSLFHLQHLFILCERLKSKELLEVCEHFQQDHSLLNVDRKCELENKPDGVSALINAHNSTEVRSFEIPFSSRDQTRSVEQVSSDVSDSSGNIERKTVSRPVDELKSNSKSENLVECVLCSFVSKDQDMINNHSKVFHSSVYKCVYCSFSHKNVALLVDHIETQCSSKDNVICSVCLYKGRDSADLVSHIKSHLCPKPFNCAACKRRFERRSLWLKHSRSHIFKKTFGCSICSLTFNTDAERCKHLKLLHAPKKYVCDECGFSASFPSVLETHKQKHRKLKLSCEEEGCDFQTSSEIMLLRHKSVHKSKLVKMVEKSKECSVCSMKFTLTKNLVRHMKTHKSQQGKLTCRLCSYETFRSDKYSEHVSNKHHDQEQVSTIEMRSSSESLKSEPAKKTTREQLASEESFSSVGKSTSTETSSVKHPRDGYNIESAFSKKHNTLMMNDEGDISIVNSNKKNSVTLRNIGNLTGTITLDERTGVLTMNNINSGSVFLNETTGELTYINLENDKNIDLNYFNQESVKQIENFKTPQISNPNRTSEVTKLDEFTGEIIKVSTSSEDNFMPEQEFDSFDMDVNDESLDGFDDFDELLFDVFSEEDVRLGSEVVLQNDSSVGIRPCAMPHLDESTGLLTFDVPLAPPPKSQEIWSGSYQSIETGKMNDSEAYQLLLDEVTGVLHD